MHSIRTPWKLWPILKVPATSREIHSHKTLHDYMIWCFEEIIGNLALTELVVSKEMILGTDGSVTTWNTNMNKMKFFTLHWYDFHLFTSLPPVLDPLLYKCLDFFRFVDWLENELVQQEAGVKRMN